MTTDKPRWTQTLEDGRTVTYALQKTATETHFCEHHNWFTSSFCPICFANRRLHERVQALAEQNRTNGIKKGEQDDASTSIEHAATGF